ncbi:hypothetical protein PoB_005546500 [Plakobranchus ocellatus]|uniref:Uncharacterized protein n=1 Tax=Plakobranchus ocellatus TaxID=259542 RepID=A0AAV4C8B8_9GAST|nr:hypothetical protein PoB_005546500 [Plakobranchus ocellatus]
MLEVIQQLTSQQLNFHYGRRKSLEDDELKVTGLTPGFIHSLASSNVTGYNIKSFYPQTDCFSKHVKLLLNSSVPPSIDNSCGQINTVWSNVNGGTSEQAMFVLSHCVSLSPEVFCHSNDDLYDDKTLAMLNPVIISTLEPAVSELERYHKFPLKTLNVHQLQKRL